MQTGVASGASGRIMAHQQRSLQPSLQHSHKVTMLKFERITAPQQLAIIWQALGCPKRRLVFCLLSMHLWRFYCPAL